MFNFIVPANNIYPITRYSWSFLQNISHKKIIVDPCTGREGKFVPFMVLQLYFSVYFYNIALFECVQ